MKNKLLFNDNCFITKIKDGNEYLDIQIDSKSVYFYRYIVPGRCDKYSFKLIWDEGAPTIKYFSDYNIPINRSLKQFQRDLKKIKIKKLIQVARDTNKRCNILLNHFLKYFK